MNPTINVGIPQQNPVAATFVPPPKTEGTVTVVIPESVARAFASQHPNAAVQIRSAITDALFPY